MVKIAQEIVQVRTQNLEFIFCISLYKRHSQRPSSTIVANEIGNDHFGQRLRFRGVMQRVVSCQLDNAHTAFAVTEGGGGCRAIFTHPSDYYLISSAANMLTDCCSCTVYSVLCAVCSVQSNELTFCAGRNIEVLCGRYIRCIC